MLRRNLRISIDHDPSLFVLSTYGSHHVRLVNHIAGLSNALVTKEKSKSARPIPILPELRLIGSNEKFGLVESEYATSFRGLIEIKQEATDEDIDIPDYDTGEVDALMRTLQIDPALLAVPKTHPHKPQLLLSQPTVISKPLAGPTPVPDPVITNSKPTGNSIDSSTPTGHKRKTPCLDDGSQLQANVDSSVPPAAKKVRVVGADSMNTVLGLSGGGAATNVSPQLQHVSYSFCLPIHPHRPCRHTLWVQSLHPQPPQRQQSLLAVQTPSQRQRQTTSMFSICQCPPPSKSSQSPNNSSRSPPVLMFGP